MKVLVGSKNPVKLNSVKETFEKYFKDVDVEGIVVSSGVSDQPINDETFIGAENRAERLMALNKINNSNAEFVVGIEGGIVENFGRWFGFGCMCIIDKNGKKSFGTSAHFELSENVVKRLLEGEELGYVMDEIINQENTKQKNGAIGYLTKGVMDRKDLYVSGIISALVPFNHPEMYFKTSI